MARVRVRFAPSPTGYLHIGGLRTALYNYLFARRNDGDFILRIEDTDQKRFVADAESDILECLTWAGIDYDEGPGRGGAATPYRQSERSEFYREAAARLLEDGHAYLAFDTEEELTSLREEGKTPENPNPKYDFRTRGSMRNSLTLSGEEARRLKESGADYVVRLHVRPGEKIAFQDLVRGDVAFDAQHLDDQVLLKSDGLPTYHLANVVDDHMMEITHVIRGEEWLPSTPKHMLLYRALGWEPPVTAHLPLILSPSGGKLSKRSAERAGIPVSVRDYRAAGYEPGALVNFLAMLGWNPGDDRELFSLEELTSAFSLDRVGQSGVQFDMEKLGWFNEQYLRVRYPESIARELMPLIAERGLQTDPGYLARATNLMKERIRFARDLLDSRYLFEDPTEYEEKALRKRWKPESPRLVSVYADRIESDGPDSADAFESILRDVAEREGVGAGAVIHPVRLAVSGVSFGPGLFELLELLGSETVSRRLRRAADTLT